MRRFVITGSTCSFGLYLVKKLLQTDCEVVALVRPNSEKNRLLPKSEKFSCLNYDLSSIDKVYGQIRSADIFFHLAWEKPVHDTKNNPEHLKNIKYSMDAVRLAEKLGCNTFVGVGSQSECGRVSGTIGINTPSHPEHAYARAKVQIVEESTKYCEENDIRCIWPRLLSSYGPYDRKGTFILQCIEACFSNIPMKLTECEQIWDYIYSEDVADALIAISNKGKHGVRYSIGSGEKKSLKQYVSVIANQFDSNPFRIGELPYSDDQLMYVLADISELTKDTKFKPKWSFENGIKETINWYGNYRKGIL